MVIKICIKIRMYRFVQICMDNTCNCIPYVHDSTETKCSYNLLNPGRKVFFFFHFLENFFLEKQKSLKNLIFQLKQGCIVKLCVEVSSMHCCVLYTLVPAISTKLAMEMYLNALFGLTPPRRTEGAS